MPEAVGLLQLVQRMHQRQHMQQVKPMQQMQQTPQLQQRLTKSNLPFKKIHMLRPLPSKRLCLQETRMQQIWDSQASRFSSLLLRRTFSTTTRKKRSISHKK